MYVEQIDKNSIASRSGLNLFDRIWLVNENDVHKCKRDECLQLFHNQLSIINLIISRYSKYLFLPYFNYFFKYSIYSIYDIR